MKILNVDIQSAGYEKENCILHDIHFSVEEGEIVGLIGPNGAG